MIVNHGSSRGNNPEWKIELPNYQNPTFTELDAHSFLQATRIWSLNVRTYKEAMAEFKYREYQVTYQSCPELRLHSQRVWDKVAYYAANLTVSDSSSGDTVRIINHPGLGYDFHLSDGDYHRLTFNVIDLDHELVQLALELVNDIKTCHEG